MPLLPKWESPKGCPKSLLVARRSTGRYSWFLRFCNIICMWKSLRGRTVSIWVHGVRGIWGRRRIPAFEQKFGFLTTAYETIFSTLRVYVWFCYFNQVYIVLLRSMKHLGICYWFRSSDMKGFIENKWIWKPSQKKLANSFTFHPACPLFSSIPFWLSGILDR